jgi:glycosyltransferase involved in cell wall biosynthesis/ADP-heptose:LPS heptosyltransferase
VRIVIDLQGAQTESRFRGIGRYTMSLCEEIARNRGEHDIFLFLNGLFADTIEPIRAAFDDLLPQANIRVWHAPGPVRECEPHNLRRRNVAERIREASLLSLQPDIVLVTSLFEGFGDDGVTSVGVLNDSARTAVILYDLVPLINPDIHFRTSKIRMDYYARKISSLTRSHCLLAISENSRQEAIAALSIKEDTIVNISAACNPLFRKLTLLDSDKAMLCRRLSIQRPFVMYTGGADERKNLHRLIEAYAGLPEPIRRYHQLVFVGGMPSDEVWALRKTAASHGLKADDLLFTGYVSDDDLVRLYNTCKLFIFPSLHEGFGLPPLEAMTCGAPVIAGQATSLREVIGWDDALFDPKSVESIRDKMVQTIERESFRSELVRHGMAHAKTFSWAASAKKAFVALEAFGSKSSAVGDRNLIVEKTSVFQTPRKKVLLTKLDHMGDLILAMPAISRLRARYPRARLDIIVGSWNVAMAETLKLFDNVFCFDFFKRDSSEPPMVNDADLNVLLDKLERYDLAIDLRRQPDTRFLLARIPAGLKVGYETLNPQIDQALGISLKTHQDVPFEATPLNNMHMSRQLLEIIEALPRELNDYIDLPSIAVRPPTRNIGVALFPKAGNAIKEWDIKKFEELSRRLAEIDVIESITIYFTSIADAGEAGFESDGKVRVCAGLPVRELIESLKENAICIANNSFGAHIASYLGLTVIAIFGGHETAAEWSPPFGDSYVIRRDVFCSPCHHPQRSDCREGMRCLDISVDFVCSKVIEAVRSLSGERIKKANMRSTVSSRISNKQITERLIQSLSALQGVNFDHRPRENQQELIGISSAITRSIWQGSGVKQLLVDVSELVHHDAQTGIQRVVRSILKEWLTSPPTGYRVEPVYATMDHGYRYARRFTSNFLPQTAKTRPDEPIDYEPGDVFFGLDLKVNVASRWRGFYQQLRSDGTRVAFMLYDLLCVQMPQYFDRGMVEHFTRWLEVVVESDAVVCISKTVADELAEWLKMNGRPRARPFRIEWSHIGANFDNTATTIGLPPDANATLNGLRHRRTFLVVGTIEPRKGHNQVLQAFEQLWRHGMNLNLAVVGKQGWMMENFIEHIRVHPELNKRFFWFGKVSDEYLGKIYAASSCLIAASEGEGFGLPLIEAARHKVPIIARDIAVFREVAGEHALYFAGIDAASLAKAIERWIMLHNNHQHPKTDALPWLTWSQSAQRLQQLLLGSPMSNHVGRGSVDGRTVTAREAAPQ